VLEDELGSPCLLQHAEGGAVRIQEALVQLDLQLEEAAVGVGHLGAEGGQRAGHADAE
jgi:hypothetical protein